MKTALITTTINVPRVLELYRKFGPHVRFFVALDKNSSEEGVNFCQHDLPNAEVLFVQDQQKWGCSELIGWNTKARRNLATLEALKWGADILTLLDDDNVSIDQSYFADFECILSTPFSGVRLSSSSGWVDHGKLLNRPVTQRGFPLERRHGVLRVSHITDAQVGVAQGLCLGDPDINAIERMQCAPIVFDSSELARAGGVTGGADTTIINSQNTAFVRDIAVCFLMVPHWHRYDDIFGGLIAQRVMREHNLFTHLGRPFAWQERNPHDDLNDLRGEMWGMQHTLEFAAWLDSLDLSVTKNILDQAKIIYSRLRDLEWMPAGVSALGEAWVADIKSVWVSA